MSTLLMRYMHDIFARPRLVFDYNGHPVGVQDGITPGMMGRFVTVYMDDILIFSCWDKEEYLRHVSMVLATLLHHCLFAKASKCAFCQSSVAFLGHVILAAGVSVDPRKTAAVSEWATPASCTDVRRFVGLANYYSKFVDRFANLSPPCAALGPVSTGERRSSAASTPSNAR